MKKIKWGIIGPGIIAKQFASDFKHCQYGELHAVASRNKERACSFAKEFDVLKCYYNYDDLYNDEEIDVIYVATPHNFHFEQSANALRAGKAVLCEKPITVNPNEFKELVKIANESGQYLAEGMWTFFLPAIKKAKLWANSGRIGEIRHLKIDFGYPKEFDANSRLYNPDLAGGALLDMGVYPVSLAYLFMESDPTNVKTIVRKAPSGVDDDVSILFEYENAVASLSTSFRCKLPNWAYIIGTDGYIAIPDFWRAKECYMYHMDNLVEHFIADRDNFGFDYEIDSVSENLMDKKLQSEIVSHATSLKFQEHMELIMKSF